MASVDEDDVLLWCICTLLEEEERNKPRFWVDPWNEKRDLNCLMQELRSDEKRFKNFTRMSISTFDYLLALVGENLKKTTTNWREPISSEARLMLTLR